MYFISLKESRFLLV